MGYGQSLGLVIQPTQDFVVPLGFIFSNDTLEHFILQAPNNPSQAELSGKPPFFDIDLAKPALSIFLIQLDHQ